MPIERRAIFNFITRPLSDKAYLQLLHFLKKGTIPNLRNPRLFNEKLIWRMIYDRRLIFQQVEDKLGARDYVKSRGAEHLLPTLYFVGENPEDIPFDELPTAFVVKPSHTSGFVEFVEDKGKLDREALIKTCQKWLKMNYYLKGREWQYANIPRKIIVEEHLGEEGRKATYNIHCFGGEPRAINVYIHRFRPGRGFAYHDVDWSPMGLDFTARLIRDWPKPKRLDEMLEAARVLSHEFEYIRVDFYELPDRLVFSEFTATAGNAIGVSSDEMQRRMGDWWKLDTSAPKTAMP